MINIETCFVAILIISFILTSIGLLAHFAYRILRDDRIDKNDRDM